MIPCPLERGHMFYAYPTSTESADRELLPCEYLHTAISSCRRVMFNPFNAGCSKLLLFEGFSAILVSPTIYNFWHLGTLAHSPEHQSARMSEIKWWVRPVWQSIKPWRDRRKGLMPALHCVEIITGNRQQMTGDNWHVCYTYRFTEVWQPKAGLNISSWCIYTCVQM